MQAAGGYGGLWRGQEEGGGWRRERGKMTVRALQEKGYLACTYKVYFEKEAIGERRDLAGFSRYSGPVVCLYCIYYNKDGHTNRVCTAAATAAATSSYCTAGVF